METGLIRLNRSAVRGHPGRRDLSRSDPGRRRLRCPVVGRRYGALERVWNTLFVLDSLESSGTSQVGLGCFRWCTRQIRVLNDWWNRNKLAKMNAPWKRDRPVVDSEEESDQETAFESKPRKLNSEWTKEESGRLPIKLEDGRIEIPAAPIKGLTLPCSHFSQDIH